jgi:predicted O-methyltransferase YrrM
MTKRKIEKLPHPILSEMFETGKVTDDKGNERDTRGGVSPMHAKTLYSTILKEKPKIVVEVGMAYGVSTLSILAGLRKVNEGGRLISIDPGQSTDFEGIGMLNVKRAGFDDIHELIEKPSYLALPGLIESGVSVDMGYIDGWHSFDYTLVDFFYLDILSVPGSIIAFNDCGYHAVRKVLRFVKTHMKYEEIDVGLQKDYKGSNLIATGLRSVLGWGREDRYFKKEQNWQVPWNFYKRF